MVDVKRVTRQQCSNFILNIHYAKRFPSVSFAFGLFVYGKLEGVVTYGTPPSAPLRRGVCGDSFKTNVIELNRLVLMNNERNHASMLVGRSMRMMRGDHIIISYADTSQGHVGYIYQATNFIYCGLSAKRTDWKIKGKEHLHGQTVADEFRGQPNRSTLMREKYGENFYLSDRPRKHRYVKIIGSRRFRKAARAALVYPVSDYPKLDKQS